MPAPAMSSTVTAPVPYGAMGVPDGVAVVAPVVVADPADNGVGLHTLMDWFNAYQDTKTAEMSEQKVSRRYYHGVQWTDEERKALEDRRQPIIENNRIGPKIDGIVGVVVRLRQDPKGYPRTEAQAAGAEIGTAAVREVLDENDWNTLNIEVAQDLAIDGIGGCERFIEQDQTGNPVVGLRRVAPETWFYDPRSVKPNFTDARYVGVYKWMDLDAAIEMMPDQEDALTNAVDRTSDSSTGLEDWDKLWYDTRLKRVKVVECWYRLRGEWRAAIYTGDLVLSDVVSPFRDDKGQTSCRYRMTSAGIDHLGNRYGFVRNMKSPQDEINHRRSKLLHIMNVSQIVYEDGAVDDIDHTRREMAKPDGEIRLNPGSMSGDKKKFEIRDQSVQMQGQAELLQEAKASIENFGPSPSLLGTTSSSQSGRALALQQQAGIAQLGPYFTRYKAWKLDVYRDAWADVKAFWTNQRFIRVAGADDVQFLPVNQMVMTPQGPRIANAIGQLDIDIVMDEGPDVTTLREDVMQAVTALINQKLLPQEQALQVVVELSDLPPAAKAKILGLGKPEPDPQQVQEAAAAKQLQVAGAQAKIRETTAKADSLQADAIHKVAQARNSGALVAEHAVHTAQAMADLDHKAAQTRKVHAEADAAHLGNLATIGDGIAGAMRQSPFPVPPQATPLQPQQAAY